MIKNKYFASALVGIVIGLLIAPRKGEETREKVSRAIGDLSDYIQNNFFNNNEEENELEELVDLQIESYSSQ